MTPQKGYYSVIQYCPDLGRFEAANIGVLLFCPETGYLKGITTRTNQRVARFFGHDHDTKKLNSLKRGIVQRLSHEEGRVKTIEDLQRFIALRANQVQITDPLPTRVEDPDNDLRQLFEEIIGEPPKSGDRKSFGKVLGERLLQPDLLDRIATNVDVTVPIFQKPVEFPYGYQNGRFNLIKPVAFKSNDDDQCMRTASNYAVEGRSLYEADPTGLGLLQLVVVGQFRQSEGNARESVRRVLQAHHVELYSDDEIPDLVADIRRKGKPIPEQLRKD